MKASLSLSLALLGLTSCSSSLPPDPRIVELHSLHNYIDSLQVGSIEVQLKKLNYAVVTQAEAKAVTPLLAESKQNLAKLDAFDLSTAQKPGLGADQLAFLIKQEGTVLGTIRSLQKQAVQDAQDQANKAAVLRMLR